MKLRTALLPVGLLLGLCALDPTIPNTNAQTETNLYYFVGSPSDRGNPSAGLVQGSDGDYYGTTYEGGTNSCQCGTVFRISPSGTYTNLHSFAGHPNDGANPYAGLAQGSDGNFYGTTQAGGSNNQGTVFQISPSGTYTNLHSFTGYPNDGSSPYAGLVQGSDGNFYGTTAEGGTNNEGTVFQVSPDGSDTILYSFAGPNEYPAGLVQGGDGNFYGTTRYGGTHGVGAVFRISPGGAYTNLYSFPYPLADLPNDGFNPSAGLAQGSDGNFYGTTRYGGTSTNCQSGCGTVFRISPGGTYTSLYSFVGYPSDGANPVAGLVQGSDGNFYGTTQAGGTNNYGTVFRISPSGTYTNQYSFVGNPYDGANPFAPLVQGSDGSFYGTTLQGGSNYATVFGTLGTVFKFSVPLNPTANQISAIQFFSLFDSIGVGASIPSVAAETYQLQYTDSMSPTNWLNTGGSITSIGGPMTLFDFGEVLPQQRFYRAVITP